MIDSPFDQFVRRLSWSNRRQAVSAIFTAVLSGAGLAGTARPASAACKEAGRSCNSGGDCCAHARCKDGKCRCRNGFITCNKVCHDPKVTNEHCGNCATTCTGSERCCDGRCVDLDRSNNHCGGCGTGCPASQECVGGTCVTPPGGCAPGADNCAQDAEIYCNNTVNCKCRQTAEGTTICAGPPIPGSFCGNCETNADCAPFGPDAVCGISTNIEVCCGPDAQNSCIRPCPA